MLEYFSIDTGEWETVRETDCKVKISKPRNIKHHRLVFSMLNYVLKNKVTHPNVNTTDRLLTAFKKAYGYCREYTDIDGSNVTEYDSISFASMNEVKFKPVAEEIKQFCYFVLNMGDCSDAVIQGLLDIEF